VAIVNSEVITLHELTNKIKELTGVEPTDLKTQDEEGYLEIRRKIIDLLIDEKITHDKVRELGIEVTPKQVDAAIEKMKRSNRLTHEDLIAGLNEQGMSYELYWKKMKNDIERMQLIDFEVKSKIIIREEQIKEYYSDHKDKFKSEEKVQLATILLKREQPSDQDETLFLSRKAEEILSRLKNGEDFSELTKKFSQGPGAEAGGDLGFFKASQLDPKLKEIIKDMSAGDVSEPIISPNAIQIIKVVERQEAVDEARDAIYRALYQEEINKRFSSWIKDLRKKAYIKIIF
jgi:peptidyl-prolyl cis-trans isomerase SurA